jgi:hypothetical protein
MALVGHQPFSSLKLFSTGKQSNGHLDIDPKTFAALQCTGKGTKPKSTVDTAATFLKNDVEKPDNELLLLFLEGENG